MKKKESFFDATEKLEFSIPERVVARKIVITQTAGNRDFNGISYYSYLNNRIAKLRHEAALREVNSNFFECLCVKIKNDDGMTWSAESVYRFLAEKYQTFEVYCLSNRHSIDHMPIISDIIGEISFLKLAVKFKLTKSFITLRSWFSFFIVLSSIALGAVLKLAELLIKKSTGGEAWNIFDKNLILYSVVFAISGLTYQYISSKISTKTTSNSIEIFIKNLKENEGKIHYMNLVNGVAEKIQLSNFPRFVIIDNFEGLDTFSKKVIDVYFKGYSKEATGSEFWIIFEKEDGETFSNIALNHKKKDFDGYEKTHLYQQLLMNDEEKARLTSFLSKPENSCFSTIKSICKGTILRYPKSFTSFHEYRKYHPKNEKKYGTIDFLFFLSLVSKPGNLYLKRKLLEKELLIKSGIRNSILMQFLYGSKARSEEIANVLIKLLSEFEAMTQFVNEDVANGFRIRPEMADILDLQYESLGLPNPKLGHLYWAFFWFDKKQNEKLEAFWIRQISYHLLNSDASLIEDEAEYKRILHQLAKMYLYVIDGCLKTCLFNNLFPLLEKAVFLLGIEPLKSNNSLRRKYLKLSWSIYSIIGNENVFELILKIDDMFNISSAGQYKEASIFNRLFLEFSIIPYLRRETLRSNFLLSIPVSQINSVSISDFIKLKALWFSQLLSRFSSEINHLDTSVCLLEGDGVLNELTVRATDRIINSNIENIKVLDYVIFSLSIWCLSLRLHPAIVKRTSKIAINNNKANLGSWKDATRVGQKFIVPNKLIKSLENFDFLVDKIESFLLYSIDAKNKKDSSERKSLDVDFLISGLFHEICIMAISSLITACVLLGKSDVGHIAINRFFSRIKDIFNNFEVLLDYRFIHIENQEDLFSEDLIKEIDSLMKLSELVWVNLGLDEIMALSCVRRTQFNILVKNYSPEEISFHKKLIESLGETMNKNSLSGLSANILVADSFYLSCELQSYYLCKAAMLCLSADFGKKLKNELSLITIFNNIGYGISLQPYFNKILEKDSAFTERNYFGWLCNKLEDEGLRTFVVHLYNAIRLIENQNQKKQIRNILNVRVIKVKSESVKEEIMSFVEIISIQEKLENKEKIDLLKTKSAWENRINLWTYPWLLEILLKNGNHSKSILNECIAVLNHDPDNDSFNSYFILASYLCSHLLANDNYNIDKNEKDIPRNYIAESINKWKSVATAEENIRAYDILIKTEKSKPQKIAFQGEIIKWQLIKIERDHLKRIPEMAQNGNFFLIVNEYFNYMTIWEMTTELTSEQYYNSTEILQEQRIAHIKDWIDDGAEMPSIIIRDNNIDCVNSKYLIIGNILFDHPLNQDPAYNKYRKELNMEAKKSFKRILKMIIDLPNIPNSIKSLIEQHSNKLVKYSLVVE